MFSATEIGIVDGLVQLAVRIIPEMRMARRKHQHRSRTPRPAPGTADEDSCPGWVNASGRRMFVVGYTPGGAPYGIFEDEMDASMDDLEAGDCRQPPF
jgi:hypothetical protein